MTWLFLLVACSPVDVYPCDREVLEIAAESPPMQVVECLQGTCDPVQWWTSGDVLVVPCDGGEVYVWW